jgi:hypothetical protein
MIRTMQPIAVGMQSLVVKSLRQAAPEKGPVLAWPLTCGGTVSRRTTALDFADGILRVEVPDAGWRAELQNMAGQYLAILNRYVKISVKRIDFVIATAQRVQK